MFRTLQCIYRMTTVKFYNFVCVCGGCICVGDFFVFKYALEANIYDFAVLHFTLQTMESIN